MTPAERPGNEPPAKHRFPKGFHRGQELFGQHAARLREPGYHEFIAQHGLVIVEGSWCLALSGGGRINRAT